MSRISRYQECINKFLKTKSSIKNLSETSKDNLNKILDEFEHINSVILLTTLHSKYKKLNGYYIASGMDILWLIVKIKDLKEFYKKQIPDIDNFCLELQPLISDSLSQNMDSFPTNNKEGNKLLKIFQACNNYINFNIYHCVKHFNFTVIGSVKKTEVIDYKFNDDKTLSKYKKLKKIDFEELKSYIDNRYGTVCKIALVVGWLLGMGNNKSIPQLEKTGYYLGYVLKIASDFKNLERDIINSKDISTNLVVNIGIKKAFEIFIDHKTEYIENSMKLGIYSSTIKEIIDVIEKDIDNIINNVDITLSSDFSVCTET